MINFNGKLYSDHQEILTANNRGYAYADALFETIRVVNGKIMFWEDHYFRLMSSMRILRMEIPMNFSPEFLENEIMQFPVSFYISTFMRTFTILIKKLNSNFGC